MEIGHQHELDADAHALSIFRVFNRKVAAALAGFASPLPLALFTSMDVLLLLIDANSEAAAEYEALNHVHRNAYPHPCASRICESMCASPAPRPSMRASGSG